MKGLILKSLHLVVLIKHPNVQKKYRYYIRDNYYSRLFQTNYFFKDYLKKKKYKVIDYCGEFQQELTFILPFAYWHHLNGTLSRTIASKGTRELYFFSENHLEEYEHRDWTHGSESFEIPNRMHTVSLSYQKWARVPLKEHYRNNLFNFQKPILVIANKFNIEWNNAPLNFFSIATLDKIITACKDKYQIIYNRPLSNRIVSDNSEILDLKEYQWLRENHPDVLLFDDLYCQYQSQVNNFNHFQLLVYANCNRFISVHGGTAALASYFGGINIILSKSGVEHLFDEFNTIFPALSGAKILHAKMEEDILGYLQEHY